MTDQVPSKQLTKYLWHLARCMRVLQRGGNTEMSITAEDERTIKQAADEIERLRTALRGIQSCSTCEACRGAATLALGGATPEPEAIRDLFNKAIGFQDGNRIRLAFETAAEADAAFDYIGELGNKPLGPSQPPRAEQG